MDIKLQTLLCLVVEEVIKTALPVGSQHLAETYECHMSPATIRNWFMKLERDGYIAQLHTSSGRIPTEKGYRLYVEELMPRKSLTPRDRQELERADDLKSLAKRAAEITKNAVLLGLDEADTFYTGLSQLFAQPEFRDRNSIVTLGEVLDRLDEVLHRIRRKTYHMPTAFIGHDCPFGNACGSVLLTLSDGTLVGLLGPMRMDYRRSFALLSMTKELLEA